MTQVHIIRHGIVFTFEVRSAPLPSCKCVEARVFVPEDLSRLGDELAQTDERFRREIFVTARLLADEELEPQEEETAFHKAIADAWARYRDAGRVPVEQMPAFYAGWHACRDWRWVSDRAASSTT